MKILTLDLAIIALIFGSSVQLISSTDPPPLEDKHVISQGSSSPSSSRGKSSPHHSWEDKNIVSEHIQTQRSRSQSPAPLSTQSHAPGQSRLSSNQNTQTSQGQQPTIVADHTLHTTSNAQNTPLESQTNTSPSTSHGSPVHEDIRKRLRSSRRPRSPFENDSSRAERVQKTLRKSKKRQSRTHRRIS